MIPPLPSYRQVTEVTGDLIQMALENRFDVIAHGANCFHAMGKGLALALARQFPEILNADRSTIYADISKLGTYSRTILYPNGSTKPLTILNCYTQHRYARRGSTQPSCNYTAIKDVMTLINKNFKGQHLGLPRIGAGLAKGKWPIIHQLIGESTPDLTVTIVHLP